MPVAQTTQTAEEKAELAKLGELLDAVPDKRDDNLLIATWNIREFGNVRTEDGKGPQRNLHDIACIEEIVKRFDVVAIQEIQDEIGALRALMRGLGDRWAFIITDSTRTASGKQQERLGFVFDLDRVKPSGLAAELVLPPSVKGEPAKQFVRTPYAVAFLSSIGQTFLLVTLHVEYGEKKTDRTAELEAIAKWLGGWAGDIASFGQNLITLGDFNIDKRDMTDENYKAFVSTHLHVPEEIAEYPSTVFEDVKHYDQIAWFEKGDGPDRLTLEYEGTAGFVDFPKAIENARKKTFRMSDHLPLWVEFKAPPKESPAHPRRRRFARD